MTGGGVCLSFLHPSSSTISPQTPNCQVLATFKWKLHHILHGMKTRFLLFPSFYFFALLLPITFTPSFGHPFLLGQHPCPHLPHPSTVCSVLLSTNYNRLTSCMSADKNTVINLKIVHTDLHNMYSLAKPLHCTQVSLLYMAWFVHVTKKI